MIVEQRLVAGRIGELPDPAESQKLVGHVQTLERLKQQFLSGRMHHAWMLSGPKGIGKATLAYHFASFVLEQTQEGASTLTSSTAVNHRISAGGNANLITLSRSYNDKTKDFKSQITVDEIARLNGFFNKTAAESGWRICIIDAADELNRNAANALLKTLEEPPANTLFLLVSHSPGGLLPTIRSRCQHVHCEPLTAELIGNVVHQVLGDQAPEGDAVAKVAQTSQGSARRAITMLLQDGLQLQSEFQEICKALDKPDWVRIHAFAGKISLKAQQNKFDLFLQFAFDHMAAKATELGEGQKKPLAELARWTEVWEKTAASVRRADGYNLDKKQVILSMFQAMHEAT